MKKVLLSLLVLVMPLLAFSQEVKVGYIDAEQIMMAMPEIAGIEKQMSEYNAQNSKYMQEMETEIKNEEAKIQTLYQRYQTTLRTIQQDAQQKQATLLKPVQDRLVKAIETVGSKNNFLFILDKNTMLYKSAKAVDVTGMVKKELNIK